MSAKELRALLTAGWRTEAVYSFAELGLADELASGPMSCDELAERVGARSRMLYRLLRALSASDVVIESDPGVFALTPIGDLLRSDKMRHIALLYGRLLNRSMRNLADTVRSGQTGFEQVFGKPLFGGYLAENPDMAELFDRAMAGNTGTQTEVLVSALDLSSFRTIVDIGGGTGTLMVGSVERYPGLQAEILELSGVVERGRRHVAERGLEQRVRFVEGSMFQEVPAGRDAYVLKLVLHDWDDDRCVEILRTTARAMNPDSTLLVIEDLVDEESCKSPEVLFLDLFMMAVTGGAERTEDEYIELFTRSGLEHRVTHHIRDRGVSYDCLEVVLAGSAGAGGTGGAR